MQVIGCLLDDPSRFLEDDTQVHLSKDDFAPNKLHEVLFCAIDNLFAKGIKSIGPSDIERYLEGNTKKSYRIFVSQNGKEFVKKAKEFAEPENFEYNYSRVKKETLLRGYKDAGVDLSWLIDEDSLGNSTKLIEQRQVLESLTPAQLAERVENRINGVRERFVDNDIDESRQIGLGAKELIQRLQKEPEMGYPLFDPITNDIEMGARLGKFYLRSASTGTGKRIADYTPIPTPTGWKTVGDIKKGDYVFGADGTPTKVTNLFKHEEQIWRLWLIDGRHIDCCKDHLWKCVVSGEQEWQVKPTKQLYAALRNGNQVWLPLLSNAAIFMGQRSDFSLDACYRVGQKVGERGTFFPIDFLTASKEDRIKFFQGFINKTCQKVNDTTLCVSKFRTSAVKEGFIELAHSLGISVLLDDKKGILLSAAPNIVQVAKIDRLSEITPMTCFTVQASDALFLVGEYVVTHNTRTAMADACYLACDQIWFDGGWKSCGHRIPTVFISVELDVEEIQTMATSFIAEVPEDHILRSEYEEGEYERVLRAIEILERSKLYIEYLPDYSMQDVENCIKRNIRLNGCNCVFLDYITSSIKIMSEITGKAGGTKIREDQILFLLSSRLKDLAGKYGVFIYSSTQLNAGYTQANAILDQNMLAGAKAIANRIDVGSIMVDMTPNDQDAIAPICEKIANGRMPNIKLSLYKNRRGKVNRVICWQYADKGTSRFRTLFVTDYNLRPIPGEQLLGRKAVMSVA